MPAQDSKLTPERAEAFILENTASMAPPHVPEIVLRLADEAHTLWEKTEEELAEIGLPPPFWAFAWAGGQGLARYVLDNPSLVESRTVLDFACGSGLVAIAAAMRGAAAVTAADIDPFCAAAVRMNAGINGVSVTPKIADLVGTDEGWDVVLAGDVFYQADMAASIVGWFGTLRARGAEIVVGDPGRSYLPRNRLNPLAAYEVPVTRALEDAQVKRTTVWRFA